MGDIVITELVSLDGVIEDPGGVEGFKLSGEVFEINRGEDGAKFKLAETLDTESLLLGRKIYEVFAANNSTVLKGDVVDEVSKLKLGFDGKNVVHGGPQNWNLENIAAALRDATDDLETFDRRGVDLLWGRKP
jgi:hypothetical protein